MHKSSYVTKLPRMPREATDVRITPSTHHLNMESGEEGMEEGAMIVVKDIWGKLVYIVMV